MMKRKFLAVILPIIGCATVVGSGFSAWYFGDKVENGEGGSFSIGINVTDEVKASKGNLKIKLEDTSIDGNDRLVLDQGGAGNNNADSGIMFGDDTSTVTEVAEDKVWAFTVSYDGTLGGTVAPGLTIGQIYDAGLIIRINLSITINGDLGKYITFQDSVPTVTVTATDLTGTNTTATLIGTGASRSVDYTITDDQVNDSTLTQTSWKFELGVGTTKQGNNYSNALLKYIQRSEDSNGAYNGGKPGKTNEPQAMEDDLTNDDVSNPSNIVFAVKAFIEDDPDR